MFKRHCEEIEGVCVRDRRGNLPLWNTFNIATVRLDFHSQGIATSASWRIRDDGHLKILKQQFIFPETIPKSHPYLPCKCPFP
jgi:hypothetical protein